MATKEDWPRCDHKEFVHRVVNFPDSITSDQITADGLPYKSSWVCERRACVLDAMAWVERITGDPKGARAIVYRNKVEVQV